VKLENITKTENIKTQLDTLLKGYNKEEVEEKSEQKVA
jgi:hypothetical protein